MPPRSCSSVFQSLEMMTTRLLVVNSRGMPCRSRLRASECQATAFSSSVWHRHLSKPDAAPVGIEGIDVVDDDELVAMPVELDVHAEGGGVALDPAGLAVEHGPHRPALGQPAGPTRISRWKCPWAKAPQILLQPLVGRQMQHLVRLVLAAFLLRGHGVSPAVLRAPARARSLPSKATLI